VVEARRSHGPPTGRPAPERPTSQGSPCRTRIALGVSGWPTGRGSELERLDASVVGAAERPHAADLLDIGGGAARRADDHLVRDRLDLVSVVLAPHGRDREIRPRPAPVVERLGETSVSAWVASRPVRMPKLTTILPPSSTNAIGSSDVASAGSGLIRPGTAGTRRRGRSCVGRRAHVEILPTDVRRQTWSPAGDAIVARFRGGRAPNDARAAAARPLAVLAAAARGEAKEAGGPVAPLGS